jgi:hypothetical protein
MGRSPTEAARPPGPVATAFRRDVQRVFRPGWLAGATPDPELRPLFRARPAGTWAEFAVEAGFLLDRFGRTAEGRDRRMQRLIQRALTDLARLIKREERRK